MPGKRVSFDETTLNAIEAVARDKGTTFQALAEEAFADLLRKHRQPVGLKASLEASVPRRSSPPRKR